jgi:large subunit ribosomal protein L9
MKVILTTEVKGKGHEGDVVEVAQGYAVNYLMPRNMAIEATSGNIKQLEARMSNIRKRNTARLTDAEAIAVSIDGKSVSIEAKAGVDGKLFGSVTTLMVEEAVAAQLGADVDHKRMNLQHPIKTAGEHVVVVGVFGDVKASLTVKVVAEGAAPEAASVAAVVADKEAVADADAGEAVQDDAPEGDAAQDDAPEMEPAEEADDSESDDGRPEAE